MRHRLANVSSDPQSAPAIAPAALRCRHSCCSDADIARRATASLLLAAIICNSFAVLANVRRELETYCRRHHGIRRQQQSCLRSLPHPSGRRRSKRPESDEQSNGRWGGGGGWWSHGDRSLASDCTRSLQIYGVASEVTSNKSTCDLLLVFGPSSDKVTSHNSTCYLLLVFSQKTSQKQVTSRNSTCDLLLVFGPSPIK